MLNALGYPDFQLTDEFLGIILYILQHLFYRFSIKDLVDGIRKEFQVEPCVELGDFCNSLVTIALGIGRLGSIKDMGLPADWNELIRKKLLKIYYPDEVRNKIFEWAKASGYNTSTYLGQPIVKFSKLFILLERDV